MPPLTPEQQAELDALIAQTYFGGAPINEANKSLDFYQNMTQTLGFDPVQLAGVAPQPQAPPQFSYLGQMYANDEFMSEYFGHISQGMSPELAWNEVTTKAAESGMDVNEELKKRGLWDTYNDQPMTGDVIGLGREFASQTYAADAGNAEARTADYVRSDGSRYKNTPLGGNDIRGWANEWDLMGRPQVTDMMDQFRALYAPNKALQSRPTSGVPEDVAKFARENDIPLSKAKIAENLVATPKGLGPKGVVDREALIAQRAQAMNDLVSQYQGLGLSEGEAKVNADRLRNDPEAEKFYRLAADRMVQRAKATNVRSVANENAMARAMALAKLTNTYGANRRG